MSNPNTLHEIDLRIRTLSKLISHLSRQVEPSDSSQGLSTSPTLQACSHFATLLMRGSEDCSNQGVGPGRRVVAVAGKLTSQVTQLTVLGTLDVTGDSPGEPHNIETIVTQNPLPNSTHGFQIQVIEPSKTTLAELAKRNESGGDAEGLHQYAQDLLAAIRDLCTSPSANYPPFCSFILRSCLPKIAHCLASDKYLFPQALEVILATWKPLSQETFEPTLVLVPDSYRQSLARMNAPMIGDHCEWSPKTAPWWIRMLCRTLEFLKTAVCNCQIHTVDNTGCLSTKIDLNLLRAVDQGLSKLMLLLKLPLRDVFELYSMRILLSGPGPYPASNPDSAPGSPSDHVDDNVDIDDEDPRELPDRDIPGSALRYLGNVVAWRRAILYVYRGVQKHMGDISLTLVLTPAPVSRRACAPMNPIVARAILKAFDSLGIEDPHRRSLLTETVNNKLPTQTAFTGTVHCEASLMGLIVSSVVDVGPLPNYLTKETVESTFKRLTTETGFVTIGVGKKCCWCCAWLAKRLHIAHPEIKFDIPRSHGQMYPWALPPVGVTVEDALALEGELEGILDRVVRRVVEETSISNALTNTSSTLGSISPGSEPDLDSEYEAMLESAVRREWD